MINISINHLPEIIIKTIPNNQQRYDTLGDYFEDEQGNWQFRISEMHSPDYELCIAVHELIEKYLCAKKGIPDKVIDEFDLDYPNVDDPGILPDAPYHKEHMFCLDIERKIVEYLGYDWLEYYESGPPPLIERNHENISMFHPRKKRSSPFENNEKNLDKEASLL